MFSIIKEKYKNIREVYINLESKIKKIMKCGFIFSLIVCLLSCFVLSIYDSLYENPDLYYIGLELFRCGLFFIVEFIICGFAIDKIKKQL